MKKPASLWKSLWAGAALLAACTILLEALAAQPTSAPRGPRLGVLLVVDQMRADYLERYRERFKDGFKRLTELGAIFSEARYQYASTETAQGHALMLSGWSPSVTGIVGDSWYDRQVGSQVIAGESLLHRVLDGPESGGSPEQLLVHTLGDALKQQDPRSLVLTTCWKRYAAVLMGGHHGDAAYWFDAASGRMVTSDYYMRAYPAWVTDFNRASPTLPFLGKAWLTHVLGAGDRPDEAYHTTLRATPFANEILLDFAKSLVRASDLGTHEHPDLLGVSFSGLDYVGHEYGPETPEFDATLDALDRQLGDLLRALDEKVGASAYVLALVADHGAAFLPEKMRERGEDAGRLHDKALQAEIVKALTAQFGEGQALIQAFEQPEFYLNYAEARRRGIDDRALEEAVVTAARAQPGIARVYTRSQIMGAAGTDDHLLQSVAAGFYPARSGDIYMIVKPNYIIWDRPGTMHGTPYDYDTHVPLIFYGQGVKRGTFTTPVPMNDLAPTLGRLLGVDFKGDPKSRVLEEALTPRPAPVPR